MKPIQIPDSMAWLEFSQPNQPTPTHWHRTAYLFQNAGQQERTNLIRDLRAGRILTYQSDIYLRNVPMGDRDRKRLNHLLTYEQAGFKISAFHESMCMFYPVADGVYEDFLSMNEVVAERGFLPHPAIAVNRQNIPTYSERKILLEVFVPVLRFQANFTRP